MRVHMSHGSLPSHLRCCSAHGMQVLLERCSEADAGGLACLYSPVADMAVALQVSPLVTVTVYISTGGRETASTRSSYLHHLVC